jgi:hypothetical protein
LLADMAAWLCLPPSCNVDDMDSSSPLTVSQCTKLN